jgi:DNA-binding LytR/AlgR family response regulator
MKIKCLIVDDEPLSQDVLKRYIEDSPMLELSGIAFDAFEANNLLQAGDVQLIFLDINMPKLSGIRFVKTLSSPPLVVFTTAYPEYAIEGFELDAVDYLVKPFPFERFLKAVNKAIEKLSFIQQKHSSTCGFILLKSDKKVYKVNYDEVQYLQSFGDYVKVFVAGKCLIVHDTFKNMQEQLPADRFVRIHKSYLIAVDKIQYFEGNQVKIANELIPIGLNYKDDLIRQLKESKR